MLITLNEQNIDWNGINQYIRCKRKSNIYFPSICPKKKRKIEPISYPHACFFSFKNIPAEITGEISLSLL